MSSLLRRTLIAATLLLWAGGTPAAQAQEPAGPTIGAIRFAGLVHVPEEQVRGAIRLKVGERFTPQGMEADRRALLALGYFRSVAASQRTVGDRAEITFRLVELPQVAHIRVTGNTVVERKAIFDAITTRVGQVLCVPQLRDDIRRIERLYRDRGYVARIAETLLDEAVTSGILKFEVLEVRIEEVQLEGGTPGMRAACRRVLTQVPPELYRPEEVSQDERRLLAVRGVKRAVPHVETIGPGRVRVRWLLNPPAEEKPSAP